MIMEKYDHTNTPEFPDHLSKGSKNARHILCWFMGFKEHNSDPRHLN